ncbi:phosphatase PAP2 family protein [Pediococcus siamensis]|uniref:phosphatase PAP2 family protein n=1 Tax=Pediococcus siamensis TaxID=381829 RepID=UPI0039A250BB
MPSKRVHQIWLWGSLISLIGFIVIALLVVNHTKINQTFDQVVATSIQANRTKTLTHLLTLITSLGNPLPHMVLVLILITSLAYTKRYHLLSFALTGILVGTLLNQAIKMLVHRDRPAHKLIQIGGYSFPSGHSTSSMIFFLTIIIIAGYLVKKNWQLWLIDISACCLTLLIGISRIYLNVHYPSDVLGGFLLGITITLLSAYFILLPKKEISQP